jgi:hypothetical protein
MKKHNLVKLVIAFLCAAALLSTVAMALTNATQSSNSPQISLDSPASLPSDI